MKIILTIAIAIFQVLIYFIPQEKVLNNNSNLFNKITKHGWRIITLNSFTILATLALLIISENESNDFNKNIEKHDSITELNRKKDAENYIKKLKENNEDTRNALLQYGFEIDSSNMELKKTITNSRDTISKNPDPYLYINNIKMSSTTNAEVKFHLPFYSADATTYNPNLKMNIIAQDAKEDLHFVIKNLDALATYIAVTQGTYKEAIFMLWNIKVDPTEYYFHVKGFYRKSPKGKKIYINNIFGYRVRDSATIELTENKNKEVLAFIKSKSRN